MKYISTLTNKRFLPLHNFLAILGMAVFGIIAIHFNWLEDYKAFILIPLMCAFFIGKYIGGKEQQKES
ncbi:hypothetical protein [Mesonia maritima]|uniref:Uncharacterized protein n=1 Tax=Mesonia maritima TaxID=1793873 RepID=A0ABU1K5E3_9FLAO|nr:hypothetical protein [Mesonia maritima]MDR6299732.1 hypothetical protein [Mesonia maritima]